MLNVRSTFAVPVSSNRAVTPSGANAPAGDISSWKASITWNSGLRASERGGATASTTRSNGSS